MTFGSVTLLVNTPWVWTVNPENFPYAGLSCHMWYLHVKWYEHA